MVAHNSRVVFYMTSLMFLFGAMVKMFCRMPTLEQRQIRVDMPWMVIMQSIFQRDLCMAGFASEHGASLTSHPLSISMLNILENNALCQIAVGCISLPAVVVFYQKTTREKIHLFGSFWCCASCPPFHNGCMDLFDFLTHADFASKIIFIYGRSSDVQLNGFNPLMFQMAGFVWCWELLIMVSGMWSTCFGLEKPSPCPSRVVQAQKMTFTRCGIGNINPNTRTGILPVNICEGTLEANGSMISTNA